ncbi:DNA phosphorothioation system sulfurtransferase DndC [Rhizobium sp. L1K21]|uniref:DNA phosphorothioation system sulfurtransferase DndC n=1 Tax=Rhizobium sp. L1K21 TaxID=2954933 RepID=UPI0020936188|nr:DNA phosphorothioation system sulfurtransferase DndC [Rhizobium sp. L1K21]MCO6185209.1 DNA phosphorothioation system sulfurtransferase DndC [Rhizobium sp. L1K21]
MNTLFDAQNEMHEHESPNHTVKGVLEEIRAIYERDNRPWVIGYSGGKDSTCALQLIWSALRELPNSKRKKPVYVLSSDTLVETPVIVDYIDQALMNLNEAARAQSMPIEARKVVPDVKDSFWVNLLGRGYPAPSKRFRWCTERLKIDPANAFIKEKVALFGEVVMVLGVRRAESATRAQVMSLHRIKNSALSRHSTLPGAYVYTPIEAFSTDDVWSYLLQNESPWGGDNRQLLAMYRNAQAGECPLVVDKNTESCGNSRFGCWVCTVVTKDKAMEAMIDNGETWLEPLLDLRDELAATQNPEEKPKVRDFRRRDGRVVFKSGSNETIPGPYTIAFRKSFLRKLLKAQLEVNKNAPPGEKTILIHDEELQEIRRLWRTEAGDWEDSVAAVVRDVLGRELPVEDDGAFNFDGEDGVILKHVCAEYNVPPALLAQLLEVERSVRGLKRRAAVHQKIGAVMEREWRNREEVISQRDQWARKADK